MKITSEELQLILANHLKWIDGEAGGARADLRGADLRGANLGGANLGGANLRGADLDDADLREANLGGTDLEWANLRGANLRGANLRRALLSSTDIYAIQNIGTRHDTTFYHVSTDLILCGCFSGTLEEFEAKVKATHSAGSLALAQYIAAIVFFRTIKEAKQNENHNSKADNLAEVKGVGIQEKG